MNINIKLITICFVVVSLVSCINDKRKRVTTDLVQSPLTADKHADTVAMPRIEVDQDSFDFGEMNQDELVTTRFRLRNIGDAPLLIRSAKESCGCTVTDWPREAIAPGDDTVIKVTFNSGKKEGKQNKTVSLVTNAIPSIKVLRITGIVLVPKNNEL